jgi:hypothetical protein
MDFEYDMDFSVNKLIITIDFLYLRDINELPSEIFRP